jgi:formate dehydrogenase major subunit
VPGLGTSFGRGGATTAQSDLANADAILIMGSSMAENHPVGFQWVMQAREKNGATVIHVDPRYTRTSAMSDIWVPLRPGSDLLFLGGLINYVLTNNKMFREYVIPFTNLANIINEDFRDTEDLDGVFSGWDEANRRYDPSSWQYQGSPAVGYDEATYAGGGRGKRGAGASHTEHYERDETLQHPRCVYQILKRHFARYTPEMVESSAGVPVAQFLKVAEAFTSASGPDKTGAICYALGWTQHSKGVQIIRSAAILQLLLGNMGRPGGGILALRGHASIQGSTDISTLYDTLPGYLPMPFFVPEHDSFNDYIQQYKSGKGVWHQYDTYFINLMKAWYGEHAKQENDWCYHHVPKITGDHSHFGYWLDMDDGKMEGLFVMGQNPAVGGPNSRLERTALSKLKWLVVREMVETETASFWYNSPEIERGELKTSDIATEVFLFPAAGSAEKEGTFTNTQRLLQYREQAVEPPGDARSETWFMYHLGCRIKKKAEGKSGARYEPIQKLRWNYETSGRMAEPSSAQVLKEISGWEIDSERLVAGYRELKGDGTTASGCWIYSGVFAEDHNRALIRQSHDYLGHGWGFSWPNDVRILYNRCSARPDGSPWSERKKLVWWDEEKQEWTGIDTPDFDRKKRPDYQPPDGATGIDGLAGDKPFILHADGVGWIFAPTGLKDGPLPTHYEPLESLVHNPLYKAHETNPPADRKARADNLYSQLGDPRFPYILSTYRLTEHHTAGGMSRMLPHLAELQPEFFCEVSPELAGDAGLSHGDFASIFTPRGVVEARVLITRRMRPLWVEGRTIHQVGMPWHWGTNGLSTGDTANDLVAISEEPNVRIMDAKALVCDIVPGRRERGAQALEQWKAHMERTA